jgi:hypothetical protein
VQIQEALIRPTFDVFFARTLKHGKALSFFSETNFGKHTQRGLLALVLVSPTSVFRDQTCIFAPRLKMSTEVLMDSRIMVRANSMECKEHLSITITFGDQRI